ncbi:hypothetical protein NDU88_000904 [Pleurodeles waltl]|uniref:Uncharacterized protein n=1 Tax=Pleurodeles waltl TaxID=8319 RepID=A0AAV7VA85_PLEWA|nr:hypothetical protein NDU88_000904 [Pleurodeles waltl]
MAELKGIKMSIDLVEVYTTSADAELKAIHGELAQYKSQMQDSVEQTSYLEDKVCNALDSGDEIECLQRKVKRKGADRMIFTFLAPLLEPDTDMSMSQYMMNALPQIVCLTFQPPLELHKTYRLKTQHASNEAGKDKLSLAYCDINKPESCSLPPNNTARSPKKVRA